MQDYWLKQTSDKPLFPDLLWSRPENRQLAGKLLVIGGNLHGFAAPAKAYSQALDTGTGSVRVLMPNAIQKIVGGIFETADFSPSTPSGSFSQKALGDWLEHSTWADSVLIAGDLGRNSETAIVLEQFVQKYRGQLIVTKDAVDYFTKTPQAIIDRPETTLVLSLAQLQQIAQGINFTQPITYGMDLIRLVDALHQFTGQYQSNIVTKHLQNIIVAANGQVSSTKLETEIEIWRVNTAAKVAVFWLQNNNRAFEALTSGVSNNTSGDN